MRFEIPKREVYGLLHPDEASGVNVWTSGFSEEGFVIGRASDRGIAQGRSPLRVFGSDGGIKVVEIDFGGEEPCREDNLESGCAWHDLSLALTSAICDTMPG